MCIFNDVIRLQNFTIENYLGDGCCHGYHWADTSDPNIIHNFLSNSIRDALAKFLILKATTPKISAQDLSWMNSNLKFLIQEMNRILYVNLFL